MAVSVLRWPCVFLVLKIHHYHNTDVLGWVQGAKAALGMWGNQGWMESIDGLMGKVGGKSAVVPASVAGTMYLQQ